MAVPALVYQDTFIIAVGPVVLLSLLVGWRSGKFNWFVLTASALFVEYIWLLAERVARGAELVAVGAGVLLLLFLELAYFGCLRSKVGKAQDHRRKYSGVDSVGDQRRIFLATLRRGGQVGLGSLAAAVLIHLMRRIELAAMWYFPLLALGATGLAIAVFLLLHRRISQ